MSYLATLLLATPIFGFALHTPNARYEVGMVAYLEPSEAPAVGPATHAETVDLQVEPLAAADKAADGAPDAEETRYREQAKERNTLAKFHRWSGMATWVAMTATVVLGGIQYYNEYGFFADIGSNPCVTGDAIFGQDQCSGTPWPHAISATLTTALYATTFSLSLMMPDPDDLAGAKGEYASKLRLHKTLRWVHFGGMIAQLLLGVVIGTDLFGLERADDYDTMQALATVHMATGLVTYGALTWAGALMTF